MACELEEFLFRPVAGLPSARRVDGDPFEVFAECEAGGGDESVAPGDLGQMENLLGEKAHVFGNRQGGIGQAVGVNIVRPRWRY